MKKLLMIAAATTLMVSGLTATQAVAGDYTKKCKACHKADKDGVGPSYKSIQAAYGDAATLAAVFESGFKVEDRKIAGDSNNPLYGKYHKKAKTMTAQYKKLIKKANDKGKISYKELAELIFSK